MTDELLRCIFVKLCQGSKAGALFEHLDSINTFPHDWLLKLQEHFKFQSFQFEWLDVPEGQLTVHGTLC